MSNVPIRIQELVQLTQVGIRPESIKTNSVTMETENFICVRQNIDDKVSVTVVDIKNLANSITRDINAESAIMNPKSRTLALRNGMSMQVHTLEKQGTSRLAATKSEERIAFWKWIDADNIGIVTDTKVMHWNIRQNSLKVMFERLADLRQPKNQVLNYIVSPNGQWCVLAVLALSGEAVVGKMQLYSVEKSVSQPFEGYCGGFCEHRKEGEDHSSLLFSFISGDTIRVTELVGGNATRVYQPLTKSTTFTAGDFPISLYISGKYTLISVLSRNGQLHVYDLFSLDEILTSQVSSDMVFLACFSDETEGTVFVNKRGGVFRIVIDDSKIVNFVTRNLGNQDLGLRIASSANIGGAEELVGGKFEQLMRSGNYKEAAEVASRSPGNSLRTLQTIQQFKNAPTLGTGQSPLLVYFQVLLDKGRLNAIETMELVKPVLAQGKKNLLEKWLKDNKIECTEELGDLVKQHDNFLALSVYLRAAAHEKVCKSFAELGQFEKIPLYEQKYHYSADYIALLTIVLSVNPQRAKDLAIIIANVEERKPRADLEVVVDLFVKRNMLQEVTAFLIDVLKEDFPEQGNLQTRLLELNLHGAPRVADAILGKNMYSHYDREKIAQLCEQKSLIARALENYTEIKDIKRVIVKTSSLDVEWLAEYFGSLSVEDSAECLKELMRSNLTQNLKFVVAIAKQYSKQIGPTVLIKLFDEYHSAEGMFYYLNGVVDESEDPEVHFKYIEATTKTGNFKEVERICKSSNVLEPKRVLDFLMKANLPDQLPLIIVCDRFGFVNEMVTHLYQKGLTRYIEIYVKSINPAMIPTVLGALLDINASEEFVITLTMAVRQGQCDTEELVKEVEKRNRLKLLEQWLEARVAEGNQEAVTHNALAKIYINSGKNVEKFLRDNQFYDSAIIGKYCEERDPHLAYIAYERGFCDMELVNITNNNKMFKQQSRYLVSRKDYSLWEAVLQEDNEYRPSLINEVVHTALPECENADEVSTTVKAFRQANLPNHLIDLLETIILEGGRFNDNPNLQNLLIYTAAKADPTRVMSYINRLDKYDGNDIANICIGHGLFEEAFVIYRKQEMNLEAVSVLIEHLQSMKRAMEFAQHVNEREVWSKLGNEQLNLGSTADAIESFLKADDPSAYHEVISKAEGDELFEELVGYLQMCKPKVKDAYIQTELIYCFAKTKRHVDMEEFISGPNIADIQQVGDRCYDEALYEAARMLFSNITTYSVANYSRLASVLVKLEEYQAAVEAAWKAGSIRTWKEVCFACVDAEAFQLAQMCGRNILVVPDELGEMIRYYEDRGHFEPLIQLMEKGITMENAHNDVFTELAILYAKYKPEKLIDHIKLNYKRMHLARIIRAAEYEELWAEVTFLYEKNKEYDSAVSTMINHPETSWNHTDFLEYIAKVSNVENYYKAVRFYLEYDPMEINSLLKALPKLDNQKIVHEVRQFGALPLVKPYLQSIQSVNLPVVNEAYNELLIEEGDFHSLKESITSYVKFDQIGLANRLRSHELINFRRISSYIFKVNRRWNESIELSKLDKLYKDAIETASESNDQELAEGLLEYFIEINRKECFSAMLYSCYDLLRPDVVMELAWRKNLVEYAMPYFIQTTREYYSKVDKIVKSMQDKEKKEEEAAKGESTSKVPLPIEMPLPGEIPVMMTGAGPIPVMMAPGNIPQPPLGGLNL